MFSHGTIAIHCGITTAQNDNFFAGQVDKLWHILGIKINLVMDIGDQVGKCLVYAYLVFTRETTLHIGIGTHAEKYRVVACEQLLEANVFANFDIQAKLNAHVFKHCSPPRDDFLFEFEWRYAKSE